jgi:hypothetical protein
MDAGSTPAMPSSSSASETTEVGNCARRETGSSGEVTLGSMRMRKRIRSTDRGGSRPRRLRRRSRRT